MNGELRDRAIAIIEGGETQSVDEKLTLLLAIALDTHGVVTTHEVRITTLERYPSFVKTSLRVIGWVAGSVVTAGAVYRAFVK